MKTTALLLLCYVFTANFCSGQNLVPNPSFEEFNVCPQGPDNIDAATHWFSSGASPDYLNTCANIDYPTVGVPTNWAGAQEPLQGNAYAALATYRILPSNNYREAIGTQLITPLDSGEKYFVSAYISRGFSDITQCASNNFGFRFSTEPRYAGTNPIDVDNKSHVNNNSIVVDTANWVWVGGSFVADSNYLYLTVGNFYDDEHTDTSDCALISGNCPYYFVDCLCVSLDSTLCAKGNFVGIANPTLRSKLITVYPNPVSTDFNIEVYELPSNYWLTNSMGTLVLKGMITKKDTKVVVSHLPTGIYTLLVDNAIVERIVITH